MVQTSVLPSGYQGRSTLLEIWRRRSAIDPPTFVMPAGECHRWIHDPFKEQKTPVFENHVHYHIEHLTIQENQHHEENQVSATQQSKISPNFRKHLPKSAEKLDESIYVEGKHLYFQVNGGWMEHSIGVRGKEMLRYFWENAGDPTFDGLTTSEIGDQYSKAAKIEFRRSAANNLLKKFENPCKTHRTKFIFVRRGRKWKLNEELDCWRKYRFKRQA